MKAGALRRDTRRTPARIVRTRRSNSSTRKRNELPRADPRARSLCLRNCRHPFPTRLPVTFEIIPVRERTSELALRVQVTVHTRRNAVDASIVVSHPPTFPVAGTSALDRAPRISEDASRSLVRRQESSARNSARSRPRN